MINRRSKSLATLLPKSHSVIEALVLNENIVVVSIFHITVSQNHFWPALLCMKSVRTLSAKAWCRPRSLVMSVWLLGELWPEDLTNFIFRLAWVSRVTFWAVGRPLGGTGLRWVVAGREILSRRLAPLKVYQMSPSALKLPRLGAVLEV